MVFTESTNKWKVFNQVVLELYSLMAVGMNDLR